MMAASIGPSIPIRWVAGANSGRPKRKRSASAVAAPTKLALPRVTPNGTLSHRRGFTAATAAGRCKAHGRYQRIPGSWPLPASARGRNRRR